MQVVSFTFLSRPVPMENFKHTNDCITMSVLQKIADFGLATQLSQPDEKHLTMCGTPNFISPEVRKHSIL